MSEKLIAGGEECRLEFDPDTGMCSLFARDIEVFRNAVGRIVTRKKKGFNAFTTTGAWEAPEPGGPGLSLQKREEWGRMLFRARTAGVAVVLELGLLWEGDEEPPEVEAIAPLIVPAPGIWPGRLSLKPWRVYVNGWQCWTPSGALKSKRSGSYLFPLFMPRFLKPMLANTATPVSSERGSFESEWFGGIADVERGDSVVLGFTGVTRALSQVSTRLGRRPELSELEATSRFDGKRMERGKEFWSEPLAVIPGDLSGENFERYAELAAAEQGVRETSRTPSGWCSWYQYFRDVSREDVLSNLHLLSERYAGLGLELVQVDDGYQAEVGDWLQTNEKFPGGMKEIAHEIASRGKVPGIWVAPLTVTRRSRIFREKKDWLIKGKLKRPVLAGASPDWGGRYYGLDPTHPEVLEHVREVFATLAGQGYRFFKLDFLATGMLEGRRHDPTISRAEAARGALEVIREAVGKESVLIAAGGPVMLGTGILDAQRIGTDVAPAWRPFFQHLLRDRATPGTRNCLINMFTRCFMSGRLFEGDPDCLLLRGADTKLTPDEIRTLASGIAVFGGALLLSDDLGQWGPEQEEMAARVLPQVKGRPRCPDLWTSEIPRYMLRTLSDPGGEYQLLWTVNWAGAQRDVEVTLTELGLGPGRYHACEFWTGRYLGEQTDKLLLEGLPAHGSAVVRLTPAIDEPRMVGSSIHVTQGAAELVRFEPLPGGLSMSFTSPVKTQAVVTLSLPGAGDLRARSGPGEIETRRLSTTVHRLEFELDRSREIELDWSGSPGAGTA